MCNSNPIIPHLPHFLTIFPFLFIVSRQFKKKKRKMEIAHNLLKPQHLYFTRNSLSTSYSHSHQFIVTRDIGKRNSNLTLTLCPYLSYLPHFLTRTIYRIARNWKGDSNPAPQLNSLIQLTFSGDGRSWIYRGARNW